MPDPERQLTDELLLATYPWIASLTSRHVLYLNPRVYHAFKQIRPKPICGIEAYFLDEADSRLGIFWAEAPVDRGPKLYPSKNERTAHIYMALLCAKYPALQVEPGRSRPFPASIEPHESTHALVLQITGVDSVPSRSRRRPKDG